MLEDNQQIANNIYRLGHIEQVIVDRELAPYNLRMNHARVLNYLNHHPGSLQKEVADFLDYQQASLTNLIKQLEKREMIMRKGDPNNGRQKRLYLKPKGEYILTKTDKIFADLNHLMDDIDPEVNQILEKKIAYLREKLQEK